jgi:osmoprotectant transport system permease protein
MASLLHHPGEVLTLMGQHVEIVGAAVAIAALIGVPTGVLLVRIPWLEAPVLNLAGILYTIPSLALFAVLIPVLGLGARPAIAALAVFSLLVIIRNTVAGIHAADRAAVDAARGMGMTGWQRLTLVELPLGLPVILAGIRTATVAGIGIATVAAYVGAGGLGVLIFDGLRTLDPGTVVVGAVLASLLAFAADAALGRVEAALRADAPVPRRGG